MGQISLERDYVMKVRVKFSKQGYIKYVGHLDTMRMFQRAIKVAKLPIAYSKGFSPHSLVYFALPLAVGVTSEGEYMELVMEREISPLQVKEQLEKVLPEGIKILQVYEIEETKDSLMSLVEAADYVLQLHLEEHPEIIGEQLIDKINKSETLMVMKKGKKGISAVDIKPLILEAELIKNSEPIEIALKVYAGSSKNLNPELLVKALLEEMPYEMRLMRKELYTEREGRLVPLYKVGRINGIDENQDIN